MAVDRDGCKCDTLGSACPDPVCQRRYIHRHGHTAVLVNNDEIATDWWRPGGEGKCWICGEPTEWAYVDIAFQHPDCDRYPTEYGEVIIIKGHVVSAPRHPTGAFR